MKIIVIGGSAAGMFASLILARAGHEVLLLERESLGVASDVESAAVSAFRTGAPQIVHPHVVLAKCRGLLLEHLPDIYHGFISAGVAEAALAEMMPPSLPDKTALPGDERFTLLMTRRSTVDWVLRRALLAQPGITVQTDTRVTGLLALGLTPPRVTGVRTGQGDFAADLVLDASGYRSAIDQWLSEIGASPPTLNWSECGLAYFSRHYRIRPGAALPGPATTRIVVGLDEFNAGVWGVDNGTMEMAVVPLAMDHRFRTLKKPEVFTAVLRTIPIYAAWLDALDPITDIFAMGAVQNTLRRLVPENKPVVTGLYVVGDSLCTTNPTLGRGLSLALLGVIRLRAILEEFSDDWTAQALAFDDFISSDIAPFYEEHVIVDGQRFAMLRSTIFGDRFPQPPPAPQDRVTYAQLRMAAPFDPTAFRAFWKVMGMICRPREVYTDPHVVACTRRVLDDGHSAPRMAQPTREQLLAALAT